MKSFVMPLLEPVGAVWALMCLSLGWLLVRKHWRAAAWLGVPTLLLFVLGSTPLPESLAAAAERPWVATSLATPQAWVTEGSPLNAVVVLGGGADLSEHDLYGFVLGGGANRVLTGIQILRLNKSDNLVLGGSIPVEGATGPLVMERVENWVKAWQLVHVPVMTLGACRDTHDEAVAFSKLQSEKHWTNVALVTSALHMARAVAVFRKQGVDVKPVACDFQVVGVPSARFSVFPRQERFRLLSLYLHEQIGWWVYKWRGWE